MLKDRAEIEKNITSHGQNLNSSFDQIETLIEKHNARMNRLKKILKENSTKTFGKKSRHKMSPQDRDFIIEE